jgi:hypothetical protein
LIPTAVVEGRVSAVGEPLPAEIQVSLNRAGARPDVPPGIISASPSARTDAQGSFRFANVLPGAYRIVARSQTMTPVPGSSPQTFRASNVRWGVADIAVAGEDLSGIAVTLQQGITVKGRVAFEGASRPPANISMRLVTVGGTPTFGRLASGVPGGTFEFNDVLPGSYTIQPVLPDAVWWLRSVIVDGRDVLDAPLELGGSLQVSGAVATFTDRHTELSGTVRSAANAPLPDGHVVIFPRIVRSGAPAPAACNPYAPVPTGALPFAIFPPGNTSSPRSPTSTRPASPTPRSSRACCRQRCRFASATASANHRTSRS